MNKVVTINLNGRAYQLEDAGYDALKRYLDSARTALADDPDRDEIMADLEQAVADKCDASLSASKNVVAAAEIEAIIKKMGPVTGTARAAEGGATGVGQKRMSIKRLFRIREGRWIMGVCNGLAAYFNIDVTLMRIIFVVLGAVTSGGWIVVYVILTFVMPVARTEDDVAAAHGETPLSAQEFVDRARAEYAKFAADAPHDKEEWKEKVRAWKREWRDRRHEWRREWRDERRREREAYRCGWYGYGYEGAGNGFAAVFAGMIIAALTVLWVFAVWSFLTAGIVFGFVVGAGHPLWVTLLFLTLLYFLLTWPFRFVISRGWGRHHGSGIFGLLFLILLFYIASLIFPVVHGWWASAVSYLQTVR